MNVYTKEEIDEAIEFVCHTSKVRFPWLADLRYPTDSEVRHAEECLKKYLTLEQILDEEITTVLLVK